MFFGFTATLFLPATFRYLYNLYSHWGISEQPLSEEFSSLSNDELRSQLLLQINQLYPEKDFRYFLALRMITELPEEDLGIITALFIIINIEHKVAQSCPEENDAFCRGPVFYNYVLPYKFANSTENLADEINLRVGQFLNKTLPTKTKEDVTTSSSTPLTDEQSCNEQRWRGVPVELVYSTDGGPTCKNIIDEGDLSDIHTP